MAEGLVGETSAGDNSGGAAGPARGALGIIFLILFMDMVGFGIIIPLLPFYVKMPQDRPFQVTMLFSVYSICQFIGAPILGVLSDRYGRRPVLAFSQLGSVIGYLILGLATQFPFSETTLLVLVYISRVIDGFSGGNVSTAQAYISDVTTPATRSRGMALVGAAFGIGFSAGPFLGGVLGAHHVSIPAYVAAGFSLIAALITLARLPESRRHKPADVDVWLHPRQFAPVFRKPVLVQLMAISFCAMAAFVMMESTIGLFLNKIFGWEERRVGWYFAYLGLVIVFVQGGLISRGLLVKAGGDWPWAIVGLLMVAIAMAGHVAIAWVPSFALLMVAGAISAIGRSLQQPTISSLISKSADPREQGVVFGLYQGVLSLARVAGPIVAGATYPLVRHAGPFAASSIIALCMGIWLALLRRTAGTAARETVPGT